MTKTTMTSFVEDDKWIQDEDNYFVLSMMEFGHLVNVLCLLERQIIELKSILSRIDPEFARGERIVLMNYLITAKEDSQDKIETELLKRS